MADNTDRIAKMFGTLSETSPGVFTSPVGLNPDELQTLAQGMAAQANEANRRPPNVLGGREFGQQDVDRIMSAPLTTEDVEAVDRLDAKVRERMNQHIEDNYTGPTDEHPNRPKHPDFYELAAIVRWMDETVETGTTGDDPTDRSGLGDVLQSVPVNLATMAYMAHQRAMRAASQLRTDNNGDPVPEQDKLVLMWLDAFIAGYLMAERRAPTVEQLLADNSNRRA